jgi:uncharacterized membrane protein YkvI
MIVTCKFTVILMLEDMQRIVKVSSSRVPFLITMIRARRPGNAWP